MSKPPPPEMEHKQEMLSFRVTKRERRKLWIAALAEKLNLSEYIRRAAIERADKKGGVK